MLYIFVYAKWPANYILMSWAYLNILKQNFLFRVYFHYNNFTGLPGCPISWHKSGAVELALFHQVFHSQSEMAVNSLLMTNIPLWVVSVTCARNRMFYGRNNQIICIWHCRAEICKYYGVKYTLKTHDEPFHGNLLIPKQCTSFFIHRVGGTIIGDTLSIENHWMDKAIPWSRCCKRNSPSNQGIFMILHLTEKRKELGVSVFYVVIQKHFLECSMHMLGQRGYHFGQFQCHRG